MLAYKPILDLVNERQHEDVINALERPGMENIRKALSQAATLGDQELNLTLAILHDTQEGDGSVPDGHLNGEALPRFAVVHGQRHQADLALGDGKMGRSVVAQQDDVVVEVHGVEFREGAAGSKAV